MDPQQAAMGQMMDGSPMGAMMGRYGTDQVFQKNTFINCQKLYIFYRKVEKNVGNVWK